MPVCRMAVPFNFHAGKGGKRVYQVLYRKWRPQTFADVYGQPQVTATLLSDIQTGRLAHAYLFTGTRGTGKTTCAKILARAVNCQNPVNGNPCNECEICRGIADESITDVIEMDAASNNGVDDIRILRGQVNYAPSAGKYLVYIIDEVHMLSASAFNALLKTLEEPPPYVLFILATTEAHKIPATILSRCRQLSFRRIDAEDIAERLIYIAEQEQVLLERDAALLIARLSDGGMRDAISLLDQCIGKSETIDENVVVATAGLAGTEHIFELSRIIRACDCAALMEQLSALHAASKDMYRLCEELISHFRSLMIINTVRRPDSLLSVPTSELARLREESANFTLSETLDILDALQESLNRMGRGGDRRIELEMCLIRIARSLGRASQDSELEGRIAAIERLIKSGTLAMAAQPGQSAQTPEREKSIPSVSHDRATELSDRASPFEQWGRVIDELERAGANDLFAAFKGSKAYICDDFILVDCDEFRTQILRQAHAKKTLRECVAQVSGMSCKFGPYRPSKKEGAADEGDEVSQRGAAFMRRMQEMNIESE